MVVCGKKPVVTGPCAAAPARQHEVGSVVRSLETWRRCPMSGSRGRCRRAQLRRRPRGLKKHNPWSCLTCRRVGRIAQLVEQLTLNQRVLGSSPTSPTISKKRRCFYLRFRSDARTFPLGAGIDVAAMFASSRCIACCARRRRSALRVYNEAMPPPDQPKMASSCATVAPAFAARVAAIFLTPCADPGTPAARHAF